MTKDELKLALKHAKRDERHLSNAETRYWCNQYKLLATQAVEALEQPEPWEKFCDSNCVWTDHHPNCNLAEKEPVVWMYQDKSTHEVRFQKHMRDFVDHSKTSEVPLYSEPLANHELQCVCGAVWCGDEMVHLPNKAPPQRKPLSDERIWHLVDIHVSVPCPSHPLDNSDWVNFARAIEAAHGIKEKNCG